MVGSAENRASSAPIELGLGLSLAKTQKVAPWRMKQLRWEEWRNNQSQEDLNDPDKVWKPDDVLQEDIQDYGREMVVIGCDVESLYPNLDVEECGRVAV